jgi:excisionase family DNA binding protein
MVTNFNKRNLTTGDIAKLCGVNFRTVIRWIQRGHLRAFQLPGRGDNRVQVADFIDFLKENDMPIPEEIQPSAKRVLLIESDEKVAAGLEKALRKAGFETEVASDGFSAGALAKSFRPAVMAVDVGMKGVDGAQAIRLMREDPELGLTKVIVLAAPRTSKKKRQELASAGADEVLDKPLKGSELVAKVKELAG